MQKSWKRLSEEWHQIIRNAGGPQKMSDGEFEVTFTFYDGIYIQFGCYSIGDWNRHKLIGGFATEEIAEKAVEKFFLEAKAEIERHKIESEREDGTG